MISIQHEDFDVAVELRRLHEDSNHVGAVATFLGLVRDTNEGDRVRAMRLEHYPGMAEKILTDLINEARDRWDVLDVTLIHRVGELKPGDQIVLVAVTSTHRADAFAACEFLVDYLKTRGPFWKQEDTDRGPRWVEARDSDNEALTRWKR